MQHTYPKIFDSGKAKLLSLATCVIVSFGVTTNIASAQSESNPRVNFPEGVHFQRFVASVTGAEAIWTNPAGLGDYKTMTALLMLDYREPKFGKDWGFATVGSGGGYSYRKLEGAGSEPNYKEHIFAAGHKGEGDLAIGLSYRYVKDGSPGLNKRHAWNLGALYRPKPSLSVGATWSNLNKGEINGVSSAVEQIYGIAIRPLSNNRLTLNAEIALSHKQKISDGLTRIGISGSPIIGLDLYSSWDESKSYEFGLRVNLQRSFFGGQSRHSKADNFRSATSYIGTVSDTQESIVNRKRSLRIGLSGSIQENPLQTVFGKEKLAFFDYLNSLYRAAADKSIANVLVTIGANNLSFAQAQEIRAAIRNLRASGKEVNVYLNSASNKNYYLACAANKIIVPPTSYLNLTGLRAELSFYAKTLNKIGVTVESEKIGAYKTATEMWTETDPTPENREMTNRWLGDLYQQLISGIASARNIAPERVRELIDDGPYTSLQAQELGLIDLLIYPDQISKKLNINHLASIGLNDYLHEGKLTDSWGPVATIAIVVAEGEITSSPSSGDPTLKSNITPAGMHMGFAQALSNKNVKALTLRVNSPGGSAIASDLIYHLSELAKESKPLTVSMSGLAASGGYYIAAASNSVFADPATITGSIGIFALKPDLSELYKKIGVNKVYFKKGQNSDFYSFARPFSEQERLKVRSGLRALYNRFIQVAAEERGLTPDSVNALGEGRVWTGREAHENGLVDSLGGIWESVQAAAQQAGVENYRVEIYPKRKTLFSFGANPLFSPLLALRRLVSFVPGLGYDDMKLDRTTESALEELLSAGKQDKFLEFDSDSGFDTQYMMRIPYDLSIQ